MSFRYQRPYFHPYRNFQKPFHNPYIRNRRPRSHSPTPINFPRQISPPNHPSFHHSKSPAYQHWKVKHVSPDPSRISRYENFGGSRDHNIATKQLSWEKGDNKNNQNLETLKHYSSPPKHRSLPAEQNDPSSTEVRESEPSPSKTPLATVEGSDPVRLCVQEAKSLFHSDCLTISEVVQLLINEDKELEERLVAAMTKCLKKLMDSHLQHLRLAKELHTTVLK